MPARWLTTLVALAAVAPVAPSAVHAPRPYRVDRGAYERPPSAVSLVVTVTDDATGAPLAGARIGLRGLGLDVVANGAGVGLVTLDDAWVGRSVELVASAPGYADQRHSVALEAGTHRVTVALRALRMEEREMADAVAEEKVAGRPVRADLVGPSLQRVRSLAGAASGARGWAPSAPPPGWNREQYAHIAENGFKAVDASPLSTFSIDVDRASYANVRRFIQDGARPPVDAVRIEELVNYFPYADPAPGADHPFAVTTDVGPAPWQPRHRLVRIGLKARSVEATDLPASNLVFLLDVSGSMNSPDKLPLVKRAFHLLVEQLRPQDRVAIVVYAGAAGLVLPSTPGSDKATILAAIDRLEAGGSTAGGAGLELAYRVARDHHLDGGNNRVILATDGDFNVGPSSDSEMIRLIEEKREQGTFLTVLGFGTGNLQDAKMEQIADHGNGAYTYIDGVLEARKALVHEMGGTLLTVAKDVKIQVEFNPARVAAYRLIGYENRLLADEDFNDDTKDAGELGAGHSVVALYEIVPPGVESPVDGPGVDALRYAVPAAPVRDRPAQPSDELLFVKLRYKEPTGTESRLIEHAVADRDGPLSADFRFSAAVAGWGMLLRDSEHAGSLTLDRVVDLARSGLGADPGGYRADFLELLAEARRHGLFESTDADRDDVPAPAPHG